VHRDVRRIAAGHDLEDLRIGQSPGDVVHHLRAGRQRRAGHRGAHGVDRDDRTLGSQLGDDRDDAVELLADLRTDGAGPGRLAADVEQVGPVRQELAAVVDGAVGVGVQAPVGK
jgi:hypothetical protein